MVELLLALALVGAIGLWLVRFFSAQQRGYGRQAEVALVAQNLRAALDLFVAEARNAGADPRGTAGARLRFAARDSIGWTADLDGDGDADDAGVRGDEDVVYFHDAARGTLVRRAGGYEAPVLEGVDSVALRYFDASGAATTRLDRIVRVELFLGLSGGETPLEASLLTGTRFPNLTFE